MFGLFGSVAHELHFCVCAGYRLLICYGPLPVFFFTASKLQFRHRVEGLRTHRFWLARARLVVAFGLFGSVASSFGTMWKGCERTVFGCLFSGLCFACLGHEACCRSRLSEASHRGILLGVGSNPAAVRAFRMGSFTAPWHVCGRFGLGTTFGSSTAFGVAVYWFGTQPRSERAGHKKYFMDSKGDGKHFFWLVFLACLSSACIVAFGLFGSVAHELHFCVCAGYIGCLSATVLYLCFFLRLRSCSTCGRVANASFLACPSSACSGVWPFRIRCQQFRHHVEGLRTHRFWLPFFWLVFCMPWARSLLPFEAFGSFAYPEAAKIVNLHFPLIYIFARIYIPNLRKLKGKCKFYIFPKNVFFRRKIEDFCKNENFHFFLHTKNYYFFSISLVSSLDF